MFRDNTIDRYYHSGIRGFEGMQKVFAGFGYDSTTGEYVLKLLNLSDRNVSLGNEISGFDGSVQAEMTVLDLSSKKNNTPSAPDSVAPKRSSVRLDLDGTFGTGPYSLVIYRFRY